MTRYPLRSTPRLAARASGTLLTLGLLLASASTPATAGERCPIDFEANPCLGAMIEKIRARGWVGIHLGNHDGGRWEITAIVPKSPAEAAGLRAGDRLVALEGVPYDKRRMADLEEIYAAMRPGRAVTYTVGRDGDTVDVTLTLGTIPEHIVAEWVGRTVLESYGVQHGDRPPEAPKPPKPPPRPDRPKRPGGQP